MLALYWWLIPIGFLLGAYGTLIGTGGGFLLVPLLLLLYPDESPEIITSISLAVVFFNATSGSVAYGRMRRIDYKSGFLFSVATVPGAILGALTTAYIPRRLFDSVFGILMVVMSIYLLRYPSGSGAINAASLDSAPNRKSRSYTARTLVDASGKNYRFSYNPLIGVGLNLLAGYLSSLLGVGGGFIQVPALVHLLNFPVHLATATSQFMLSIMALAGTLVHIMTGTFAHGVRRTVALAIGVVAGAQMGAVLSNRFQGDWIIRGLAVTLAFVGIRILFMAVL